MWKKTEVVFYFQSCYLPTWIANGIPNKTWTDFAFVVGVSFFGLCLETTCYINIHDFEQPHFCFNRFLSVRKLQRVRETLWMLPAHHTVRDTLRAAYITPFESERHLLRAACIAPWKREKPWELLIHIKHLESERHPESCLHHTHLVRVRDTLRAACITPWEWEKPWELLTSHLVRVRDTLRAACITPWEWETPWELLNYITPCESERHFESCLHHTLRVRDTLRAACITTCESVRKPCDSCPVRHSVRVLPGGISCELWCSDTLWEIPCEIYTLRQFLRRIEDLFRVFHCGQGRFDRTENVKTAHETTLVFGNCTPFFRLAQCVKFVSITMHAAHWHRGQNSKQTLWNNISMDMFFLFVFSCQDLHFCCTQLGK